MKKLTYLILIFCIALSVPLGYFILKTYQALDQEEEDALRYFGEMLFNQMEDELAAFVIREEQRAIDYYQIRFAQVDEHASHAPSGSSPADSDGGNYIVGYLQNNPDGSFHTPLFVVGRPLSADKANVIKRLASVNTAFNHIRTMDIDKTPLPPFGHSAMAPGKSDPLSITRTEGEYLFVKISRTQKTHLGQDQKRVQHISPQQAMNMSPKTGEPLSPDMTNSPADKPVAPFGEATSSDPAPVPAGQPPTEKPDGQGPVSAEASPPAPASGSDKAGFQAEVAPLQSVILNDSDIFVFRRIEINNRIYRQGVVLNMEAFLKHLAATHFLDQPMARFTNLRLDVLQQDREVQVFQAGIPAAGAKFKIDRTFPRPFAFLQASLACDQIPRSRGRQTLSLMIGMTGLVIVIGLFTIYKSARTVVDMSERRTTFVSSVTHELKTPLTNIRMYIEMLEQGIAASPEKEQAYFSILESESGRLSRLINNVLEFSKLEKRQRHLNMHIGDFTDVLSEVQVVMRQKLIRENFELRVENRLERPFAYDREVMIQILINLIENSIKFGREVEQRVVTIALGTSGDRVTIRVSDAGPGIPRHALRKVFNDFYRVDNSLTRKTGGTGIGLALVKKFVIAMGGTVVAFNNDGPGCTIAIEVPEGKESAES